jgi:hypothetical protein
MIEPPSDLIERAAPARPLPAGPLWRPLPDDHPILFRRGALAVMDDPAELLRHGIPLALSGAEVALMALLVRRGRAGHGAIAETLGAAGVGVASLDVLTYRIRRKFAVAGAPDPIQTRRGWGLVLRVEPDRHGSTGLWIGGRTSLSRG